MKLHFPLNPTTGLEDQTQLPWSDGVPQTGQEGSYPPSAAVVEPMTELANLLDQAGITGTSSDLFQVTRAVRSGQLDFCPTDTGTADTMKVSVRLAHRSVIAGLPFSFIKGPNTNATSMPVLTITDASGNNPVSGLIVKRDGTSVAPKDLPGGVLIDLRADGNGNFRLRSIAPSDFPVILVPYIRPRATGNVNLYVNVTTGSDSNTALSAAAPFKTMAKAVAYASSLDFAGFSCTITAQAGTAGSPLTYDDIILSGPLSGSPSPLTIISSSPTIPAATIIANTRPTNAQSAGYTGNIDAVAAVNGAQIFVNGFSYQSTNGNGLHALGAGSLLSYSNPIFGACPNGNQVFAQMGEVAIQASTVYGITGSAQNHFATSGAGSNIYNNGGAVTVTLTGTPNFYSAFANLYLCSSATLPSLTFSGSATGVRYSVAASCVLLTNGGGANYFPGNAAGVNASTGTYA